MMLLIIILTCNKKLYFAIIINKILIFHCFTCLYFNQNKKIKIIINIKRNYTFFNFFNIEFYLNYALFQYVSLKKCSSLKIFLKKKLLILFLNK